MARRILNRRELRAASDAAARRKDKSRDDSTSTQETAESASEKKPKARKKTTTTTRTRKSRAAKKVAKMKVVWAVFSNANQQVKVFEYSQRAEAEKEAAKLTRDKKSTHFVNPVKVPIEESSEEETST